MRNTIILGAIAAIACVAIAVAFPIPPRGHQPASRNCALLTEIYTSTTDGFSRAVIIQTMADLKCKLPS